MSNQLTQQSRDDRPPCKCVNLSWSSEDICANVICILHPVTELARKAAQLTAELHPQHLLQDATCEAPIHNPNQHTHDIALRYTSDLLNPSAGFLFGRNKQRCDILITTAQGEPDKVSSVHFRIYLKSPGILMLEDLSTNGTTVDFKPLRSKHAGNRDKPSTQMLVSGSQILVISNEETKSTAEFIVRVPARDGFEEKHQENVGRFLSRIPNQNRREQGLVRSAVRLPSNTYHGMHWSGGEKYTVVGQIGRGTFATVFTLATKTDGKLYACKELERRRSIEHTKKWSAVAHELRIMERLDHPNIVEFHEYHENSTHLYIIMEHVPYGDLSSLLRKQGRMPEDFVRVMARQILHALSYLHSKKVAHRDIKPDNILIASINPLRVKLSDFGLSKMVHEVSMLNTFCGTPLYCAPEVYPDYTHYDGGQKKRKPGPPSTKSSPYDQSVDMWSFGAVIYHLLCGVPPYRGRPDDRGALILDNMMNYDPEYAKLRLAGVSEEGIGFVASLLKRNPKERASEQELFHHPWIACVPDEFDYEKVEALQSTDAASSSEQRCSTVPEEDKEKDEGNGRQRTEQGNDITNCQNHASIDNSDNDHNVVKDKNSVSQAAMQKKVRLEESIKKSPLPKEGTVSKRVRLEHGINEFSLSSDQPIYAFDIQYPSLPLIHANEASQQDESALVDALPRPIFEDISPNITTSASTTNKRKAECDFLRVGRHQVEDISSSSNESPAGTSDEADVPLHSFNRASTNISSSLDLSKFHIGSSHPHYFTRPARGQTAPATVSYTARSSENHASKQSGDIPQAKEEKSSQDIRGKIPDAQVSVPFLSQRSEARSQGAANCEEGIPVSGAAENGNGPSPPLSQRNEDGSAASGSGDEVRASQSSSQRQSALSSTNPLYGELVPLPGSIIDTPIPLTSRKTSWGRAPDATIRHPDPMDVRIPIYALEVTFWTPGIVARLARGEDWTQVPEIFTILSTKTSQWIRVNGVKLHKETPGGEAPLIGRLYNGDIVNIFQDHTGFLSFECRIYHGLSAQERPPEEAGFVCQQMRYARV